jgi:hypothetical protein
VLLDALDDGGLVTVSVDDQVPLEEVKFESPP